MPIFIKEIQSCLKFSGEESELAQDRSRDLSVDCGGGCGEELHSLLQCCRHLAKGTEQGNYTKIFVLTYS